MSDAKHRIWTHTKGHLKRAYRLSVRLSTNEWRRIVVREKVI